MPDINIPPHGRCETFEEHDQVWTECKECGAQWAVHGPDDRLEQVSEGDGYCAERAHVLEVKS